MMENEEGEASHADEIRGVNEDLLAQMKASHVRGANEGLLAKMKDRISKSNPSLRREPAPSGNRCIFKLPQRLKKINGKLLEPQEVAIGPYHRGKRQLKMREELKWRCLDYFLKNAKRDLEEFLEQIYPLEKEVRECYSETINLNTNELLQMMVVDGCFILYLLLYFEMEELSHKDNPLYRLERVILPKIYGDLLLLENQIPSIVLEKLYEICGMLHSMPLSDIATNAFSRILEIPDSINRPPPKWLHLLDLVRWIFIPRGHNKMPKMHYPLFSQIPCVTKLRRVGIKVSRHMANSFLEVKFKGGLIEMPLISLDHAMCSLLVNCVAFEQSHNSSTYFSIYATFLDGLVNTARDIEYLSDRRVIDSSFGTDAEVASFINNLGKDLTIYNDYIIDNFYLLELFGDLGEYYYRKRLNWANWHWTSFKREYFGKPWLLISAFVAFVLLVLTFLQTFYTIYAYVHPKN